MSDSEHSPDRANGSQPLADPPPDQTGGSPPVVDADIHPSVVTTPAVRPPGAGTFSLEGRAAPGLYLVAWLASVVGLGVLVALLLSSPGGTGALVLAIIAAILLAVGLISAAGAQALERRQRGVAYAGPSPFLVFGASLPVVLPVAVLALRIGENAGIDPASPLASVIGQIILIGGLLVMIRLLVVGMGALRWRDMGLFWPGLPAAIGHLASGAVLAVPVIVVTAIVSAILISLLGTTPDSPLPPTRESSGIALNFLAAAVIAPIGEEIFFRGFSLTAWERTLGWRAALVRSALFFAFVHVLTVGGSSFGDAAAKALIAFVARIPVALALGYVFVQRRSILAPIGLHATYNALLLLIAELAMQSA